MTGQQVAIELALVAEQAQGRAQLGTRGKIGAAEAELQSKLC